MVLSVLVAMILTPALCATLLKPVHKGETHGQRGFFGWFNRTFNRNASRYETAVGKILHRSLRWIMIYVLLLGGMVFLFLHLPTSFLPLEDRGMFTTSVQLPSGSTQQQTLKVVQQAEDYFLNNEKQNVESVFATIGSGPRRQRPERGAYVRTPEGLGRTRSHNRFHLLPSSNAQPKRLTKLKKRASLPAVRRPSAGLGSSAGFDMELGGSRGQRTRSADGPPAIPCWSWPAKITSSPASATTASTIVRSFRWTSISVKAQALGVSIDDINDTLQTAWGSSYVNDFMDRGRVKKVYVQAAAPYRMLPDDINLWYVRNSSGTMVPFSAFATSRWETGSPRLERYNGYSAVEIVGEAAPGVSTGTAMTIMEELAQQLPNGFGLEWTAMSYQERLSGAQAPALYAISLLVVFLCLAALYESWSVPFSVDAGGAAGVIGALLATWMRGLENDVYFQVGLLTVIGLSAKNAILIVEFCQ
ncbi:aminoglycoside efflux pump [Klebsiella michiganensis]|uniref:Aminoglycoside efflux pump n=1 Tax=Klebsiella michiganensis TaxID=1134687 RepID=A0A7H4PNM0_9ENTR|nr:aminoglycoside efflux pump [Klebsiella michiganensis]